MQRFIPVHTGNSYEYTSFAFGSSVHPRAYGEQREQPFLALAFCGSSPCIRGTGASIREMAALIRFIPVHTGNSLRSACAYRGSAVHPRAYGEQP